MKIIILLGLLFLAGCGDSVVNNDNKIIITNDLQGNSIIFTQEFLQPHPQSIIIHQIQGTKSMSVLLQVQTLDSLSYGFTTGFTVNYNLVNSYQVDLGNGQVFSLNSTGFKYINWNCNQIYNVIITNE